MTSTMTQSEQDFRALLKEMNLLDTTNALLDWDGQTYMPEDESDMRAELVSYVGQKSFQLETGAKMKAFVDQFTDQPELLSTDGKLLFKKVKKNYDLNAKVPAAEMAAYTKLISKAQSVWMSAHKHQSYAEFKPYLKQIIEATKRLIQYWKTDQKTDYDVLLDQYEPGMTVAMLDPIFTQLRDGVTDLRAQIADHGDQPNDQFMHRYVSETTQTELSRDFVSRLGFDFNKGSLDISMHPFTVGMNRNDARITTRYGVHDFQMSLLGSIHEASHSLYQQNIDPKWDFTLLSGGASMGIHESQSLFNEVMIGRNYDYWKHEYPRFLELTGETFSDIDFETFYRGFNTTHASLIRTEADPLTYPLHIIIRYELEKAIINGNVDVDELPSMWNQMYQDYLGITPDNDADGILQDIHWAGGDLGYFPSYALGHLYAAQFLHAMSQTLDLPKIFASGNYQPLIDWRKINIHQFGASKEPNQIVKDATGEALSPKYWLAHQQSVYKRVYRL